MLFVGQLCTTQGTSDIKELHSSYAAQLVQAATAATQTLRDVEEQLSACVQQQQQQLGAYGTQHAEAVQAATAANAALVGAAVAALQRVGQAGVDGLTAATEGLAQQAAQVQEAETALHASLAEQEQQLRARVEALLTEHAAQTRAAFGGCMGDVRDGLAAKGAALRAVASELDGTVAAAAEGVKTAGRDADAGAARLEELAESHCRQAHEGLAACRGAGASRVLLVDLVHVSTSTGATLREAADAERLAAGKLLDSHTAAMEASLEGTAAAIDAAAEAAAARLDRGAVGGALLVHCTTRACAGAAEVVSVQEGVQRLVEAGARQAEGCVTSTTEAITKDTAALQGACEMVFWAQWLYHSARRLLHGARFRAVQAGGGCGHPG